MSQLRAAPALVAGDLEVDVPAHAVRVLAQHAGRIVTRRVILREVWGPQAEEQSHYLRVHLTHVRRKLAVAGLAQARIENEPGIGYRLVAE